MSTTEIAPFALTVALLAVAIFLASRRRAPVPVAPVAAPTVRAGTTLAVDRMPTAANTNATSPVHLWVATPAYGDKLSGCAADSLCELDEACRALGVGLTRHRASRSILPKLRSEMVHTMLASTVEPKATHFIFCDADIGYRAEDVLGAIGTGFPIVGLPCAKRELDFAKMAQFAAGKDPAWLATAAGMREFLRSGVRFCLQFYTDGTSAIVERDCVKVPRMGTGVLIVERGVLEALYAQSKDRYVQSDEDVMPRAGIFECGRLPRGDGKPPMYIDEDYAFSERCRKAGYEVRAYLPARTKHHGVELTIEACMLDWEQGGEVAA